MIGSYIILDLGFKMVKPIYLLYVDSLKFIFLLSAIIYTCRILKRDVVIVVDLGLSLTLLADYQNCVSPVSIYFRNRLQIDDYDKDILKVESIKHINLDIIMMLHVQFSRNCNILV